MNEQSVTLTRGRGGGGTGPPPGQEFNVWGGLVPPQPTSYSV